jgi:chitinase
MSMVAAAADDAGTVPATAPKLIAYVTGWSPPVSIDTGRITHVNFAFARIDGEGRVVLPDDVSATRLGEIVALKRSAPALRVLISVGGWGAEGFSDAAFTEESRARFADSAVALMRAQAADGIDLDWEYPGQSTAGIRARAEDKRNFTLLLATLRERLDARSRDDGRPRATAICSTIASADRELLRSRRDRSAARELDWINVMAYDFYNSLTPTTGHHAGLYRARRRPFRAAGRTRRWSSISPVCARPQARARRRVLRPALRGVNADERTQSTLRAIRRRSRVCGARYRLRGPRRIQASLG